jgi:hypothetical protein
LQISFTVFLGINKLAKGTTNANTDETGVNPFSRFFVLSIFLYNLYNQKRNKSKHEIINPNINLNPILLISAISTVSPGSAGKPLSIFLKKRSL